MILHAKARGDPKVTTCDDAIRIFELGELSSKDRFCDLGCGHGRVVRWASRKCEFAYGIEDYSKNLEKAVETVKHIQNAKIIKGNFLKDRLPNANVLYSVNTLSLEDFRRWNKLKRRNFRIVTFGPLPIPIKPVKNDGPFYLVKFPFEITTNRGEWYHAVVGRRNATWKDVNKQLRNWLNQEALKYYEQDYKKQFDDCKGCNEEIDEKFVISESKTLILNHKMGSAVLGQLVLMPRKRAKKIRGLIHPLDPSTLTQDEYNEICKILPTILKVLSKVLPSITGKKIERVYVATFNEDADWHFHIHIVPRFKGKGLKGPRLITRKKKPMAKDVMKVVTAMRRYFH